MNEQEAIVIPNSSGEMLPAALPAVIQPKVRVIEQAPGKEKPGRIEREIHHRAFAFYFALGPTRTLAKVAQEFNLKDATALNWSATFGWKERLIELENRSKESEFREKAMDLLLLTMDSLVKRNKKTGVLILANTEKATVEKLKMAIDSFKRLRDDSREGEPSSGGGSGGDASHRGPKTAVQVNVTIIKT